MNAESSDAERLWTAMLVVFPAVVRDDKQPPAGAAHLVREHAEALLHEWKLTSGSRAR